MATKDFKRKLSAILSADVAGYSRLMGEDEAATVSTIETYREVMSTLIKQHRGRVVDSPGDNVLAEFASVVDAVQCGVAVQNEFQARNAELPENRRMQFRIGINLGDVIEEGDRIYGDGVNIAARLEALADPGGICISKTAFDHIETKLPLGYEYLGDQTVKNIAKPVGAYRVLMEPRITVAEEIEKERIVPVWRRKAILVGAVVALVAAVSVGIWNFYFRPPPIEPASVEKMAYPLPDKPSIAVLPFVNMSGDPEQEYFSDGITEEIITALSKIPKLFVIARNSTFTYKGKPVKVQQVSEELGVQYVVEGSVRKAEDRVRITAQLVDALTGHHIWAEKYDREVKDIFSVQDEITKRIVTALQVELTEGEQAAFYAKGTDNLEAYLKSMKATWLTFQSTKEGIMKAKKLAEESIILDPNYAFAYKILGSTHLISLLIGLSENRKESFKQAIKLQKKAIELDDSLAVAHGALGYLLLYSKQYVKAIAEGKRAYELEPNSADVIAGYAGILTMVGDTEKAILLFKEAIRLNPKPPTLYLRFLAIAYRDSGQYEDAIIQAKKATEQEPNDRISWQVLTSSYSLAGREKEAQAAAKEILRIDPDFYVNKLRKRAPQKDKAVVERFCDALQKAGLPEHPPLPLPDKPSIAVLPFTNMSEDPKQEYFSDGMSEQIITSLSKVSDLFVIARTSSFRYKGKEADIKHIGRELGVRYVLEGSVQRSGDRLRINAQLIDAKTSHHLWAERYDRDLKDIFALQDDITKKILTALRVKLTTGEDARIYAKSTDNFEAYLKSLEGHKYLMLHNEDANRLARQMFKEAIAMDLNYSAAYQNLSWTYIFDVSYGWTKSRDKSLEEASELAQKALALDDSQAHAYAALSAVHVLRGEIREAVALREKAVAIAPNSANYHALLGIALLFKGDRTEEAIKELKIATRLDPFPPNWILHYSGVAYRVDGEYGKAIEVFKKAVQRNPNYWLSHLGLAACYGLQGREEEAREAAAEVLRIRPKFSLAKVKTPFKDKADKERTYEVLRKAGLK